MTDRASLIDSFLAARGWDGAERTALASDASFRRYERLTLGDRGAVLMDAPPPEENVDAFVAVARHLKSLGRGSEDQRRSSAMIKLCLAERTVLSSLHHRLAGEDVDFDTAVFDLKTIVHAQRLKYAAQRRNRSAVFQALDLP